VALTGNQKRFIQEWLADPDRNGTAAYRKAYPNCKSDDSAGAAAARLLGNVRVQEEISRLTAEQEAVAESRRQAAGITRDRTLREVARIAYSDISQIADFNGDRYVLKPPNTVPKSARRCIKSIKVKQSVERGPDGQPRTVDVVNIDLWSKDSALDKLMKHFGLYKDREPLEAFLALLPPELAGPMREALRSALAARGSSGGSANTAPTETDPGVPPVG
jgi:phage terminase small subunit